MERISVVIPCYKTSEFIYELYTRLSDVLQQICLEYEIIFVDDASPSGDGKIVAKLCNNDNNVKLVKLLRNFGQHAAISAGLKFAKMPWVVVMDADLQDLPEEIPKLVDAVSNGYDIALGKRKQRKDPVIKKVLSYIFHQVFRYLTGYTTDHALGNFGIYSSRVIASFNRLQEQYRGFWLLINWFGYKTIVVDVKHNSRNGGKSSYSLFKRFNLGIESIIAFSDKPLKIITLMGFIISIFSMMFGTVYLIRAVIGYRNIIGWSSLFISIWFLSGLLMFIIGMVGIYIGKIFNEVKKRPSYIIDITQNIL